MIKEAIEKLKKGENLGFELTKNIFDKLLEGVEDEELAKEFLSLLADKKETADEIYAAALSLREHADGIEIEENALDTCGTGGDGKNTFNISTASAILCSLFIPVAKHGNRAVSSKSGSADVLDALSIPTTLSKDKAIKFFYENKFAFLFAPNFHPATKNVAQIRKKLKRRTIFNLIGPLANPFFVKNQLIGVFSTDFTEAIFEAALNLGIDNIAVVSSYDGMDEISPSAKSICFIKRDGIIKQIEIDPLDFGIHTDYTDIKGEDAKTNAKMLTEAFEGKRDKLSEIISLNAGFSLYISGIADTPKEGFKLALESIKNGKALEKLNSLRRS
ncbi:anthranilate phosphoribosyltransferase [Hippea alviniae]|uniref:anthranilate phosphoribosyltransferase n=1 Tax=Hippea alviniae TaxID=1279027 RepID=UPI0003B69A8C|nr:anthranilate phosphoribosyltransferase [Hippea alviniae]